MANYNKYRERWIITGCRGSSTRSPAQYARGNVMLHRGVARHGHCVLHPGPDGAAPTRDAQGGRTSGTTRGSERPTAGAAARKTVETLSTGMRTRGVGHRRVPQREEAARHRRSRPGLADGPRPSDSDSDNDSDSSSSDDYSDDEGTARITATCSPRRRTGRLNPTDTLSSRRRRTWSNLPQPTSFARCSGSPPAAAVPPEVRAETREGAAAGSEGGPRLARRRSST